jgi:hypothetical protein
VRKEWQEGERMGRKGDARHGTLRRDFGINAAMESGGGKAGYGWIFFLERSPFLREPECSGDF